MRIAINGFGRIGRIFFKEYQFQTRIFRLLPSMICRIPGLLLIYSSMIPFTVNLLVL